MIGCGTTITGQTTTAILKVTKASIDYGKADKLDITDFESADNTKEFELGMDDPGEITLDIIYDKTNNEKLVNAKSARTLDTWTVTYPDGSTDVFQAYITDVTKEVPVADKMTQTVVMAKTGATTFTKGG
jgi:predicted secreted protein